VTKETYRIWRERNQTVRPNVNENTLMNQKRQIEKQNKLTSAETDMIKQQISEQNGKHREPIDSASNVVASNNVEQDVIQNHKEHVEGNEKPEESNAETVEMLIDIQNKCAEMKDIDVSNRIPLPKINVNTRTKILIKYANIPIEQLTADN